ncbi:MAG: tetratricopeptide repeat protein, partial [Candidatus Firestonebacteria bacterium]|nr:tetratricopeptide repeat protein [Candidatus Firestonebacteria bacterium]
MKKNIFSAIIIYILLCLSNNSFAVNLKTSLEKLKELYREKKYTQAVKFIEADYEIQNVLENTEYINGIPESYCYLIACSYYQAKEYEKAINYYSKVTQKESILSDYALFHMSECYKYKKKYSSAIYYYELLTEKYPRSSNLYEAYYNKAECYEKIGKYIESIDELNKIIKMSPQWNPARVLLKKGRIFELMHKWTDAETIYQKIVSIYPKSSDTQEALMRICYIEKKYPAYKIEKKAEEIWDRGMAYFYSHEYRNAVNQFKEIIDNKLDKELEDNCYNMIGKAYYKRYNFWKAIDFFKVATEKYHQGETYIDSLFELANSYVIVKNGDSALFIYNKIDTEYSYSGYGDNALYRVAKYYESRKKYDESIKNYLQLIKKYPQSIYKDISYWNIACICIQQNHMEDAINYFKTLYHDLPQSKYAVEAYFWAGKCFEKSGNWIEAAEIYRKILIENYNKTYFYYRAQERLNWINSNKYECLSLKEEKDFFDTAKEYYNKKNYTMAIENFRKVINLYGNSKRALSSINIVKKCFKEQKIWPEIFNNDEIVTREKLLDSFISKYVYAKGYSNRLDY